MAPALLCVHAGQQKGTNMSETPAIKDPHTVILETGIHEAAETARHYLDKLLGGGIEQGGGIISDTIGYWRFTNKIKLVLKAKEFLESQGIDPAQVLPKVAVPLLEAGSLENDENMQGRWAALLANAGNPATSSQIIPAYGEILRQLTPVQAQMLDWMYSQRIDGRRLGIADSWPDFARRDIEARFDLQPAQYALLITDMERLQLIEPRREIRSSDTEGIDADEMFQLIVARWNSRVKYDFISLTSLGLQFMKACQPPA